MFKVNVSEASRNLKALLEQVEAGEEIILVEEDKPVARLVPPSTKEELLTSMKQFRDSLGVTGEPLSTTIIKTRSSERF